MSNSSLKLLDFQQYQLAFTQHLRHPQTAPRPAQVVAKRMAVYTEIVFNNIFESVSACFPVAQSVLGKRRWLHLVRGFFADNQAQTPLFKEIPNVFLSYLETRVQLSNDLPDYLYSLAHYEWVELALSMSNADAASSPIKKTAFSEVDFLTGVPKLAVVSTLCQYDYPVHKISVKFKPKQQEPAYFFVFRNADFQVKFIVLNALTFRLLQLIQSDGLTGQAALEKITQEIKHENAQIIIDFGVKILQDLHQQGAIVDVKQ